MFDKIGRYAESVATSAGESRRGFLGQLGKAALGVAGVVGGLLLFPAEARATPGYCEYICPDGRVLLKGCPCQANIKHAGMICPLSYHVCPY
jgi:hypothetical protein